MKPPQPAPRKRFYRSATVAGMGEGGYGVLLDGRQIRTPAGKPLAVPSHALASAIAEEWNAQNETIAPASMPLTKLANTAIDAVGERRAEVMSDIVKYAAADLVCYRAAYPSGLVAAQARAWDPILEWATRRFGTFLTGSGVAHVTQPASSLEAVRAAAGAFDAFKLTALHVITSLAGSALIALALASGELDAGAAWAAAHVDENWQTAHWGEDFEAAARLKIRQAEFEAAFRFFELS